MTPDDRFDRPTDPHAGDPLDELLAQAQWPEPTPLQLARLERQWDRLRPQPAWRRWVPVAAAAAAVLAGALWWGNRPGRDLAGPDHVRSNEPLVNRSHSEPLPLDSPIIPTPPDEPDGEPRRGQAIAPTGRPATTLEAVAFAVQQQRQRQRREDPLGQALRTLDKLDPNSDPALWIPALAAEMGGATEAERQAWEDRLIGEISQARGERRRGLVRLLGEFAGPRSVPLLAALSREPQTRPLAEPILLRVADPLTLLRLASAERHPVRQSLYLDELLTRSDSEAHALFFQAAAAPVTRRGALLSMQRTANPPTAELFAALSSPHPDVRTVAALLIGEIRAPEVTDRLIGLALREPNRETYWIALLQRRDAESVAFIRRAERHPQLMATVGTAEFARRLMTEDTLPPVPF